MFHHISRRVKACLSDIATVSSKESFQRHKLAIENQFIRQFQLIVFHYTVKTLKKAWQLLPIFQEFFRPDFHFQFAHSKCQPSLSFTSLRHFPDTFKASSVQQRESQWITKSSTYNCIKTSTVLFRKNSHKKWKKTFRWQTASKFIKLKENVNFRKKTILAPIEFAEK